MSDLNFKLSKISVGYLTMLHVILSRLEGISAGLDYEDHQPCHFNESSQPWPFGWPSINVYPMYTLCYSI